MRHVVMFSSGLGSWAAAKRVAAQHQTTDMVLLFADTKEEDADNYRFLVEAATNVGAPLVRVEDGRSVWQLFRDEHYIGNNRLAICSRVLKREVCAAWVSEHCDPGDTHLYVGIDWGETHRLPAIRAGWSPYRVEAPLEEAPPLDKRQIRRWAEAEGLRVPRLYDLGFPHANCGGACVRAGQTQWKLLLETRPDVFRRWEREESAFREAMGKDVAILRDRRGGKTRPLPLVEFRQRIEADRQPDLFDWGGCGCFTED